MLQTSRLRLNGKPAKWKVWIKIKRKEATECDGLLTGESKHLCVFGWIRGVLHELFFEINRNSQKYLNSFILSGQHEHELYDEILLGRGEISEVVIFEGSRQECRFEALLVERLEMIDNRRWIKVEVFDIFDDSPSFYWSFRCSRWEERNPFHGFKNSVELVIV